MSINYMLIRTLDTRSLTLMSREPHHAPSRGTTAVSDKTRIRSASGRYGDAKSSTPNGVNHHAKHGAWQPAGSTKDSIHAAYETSTKTCHAFSPPWRQGGLGAPVARQWWRSSADGA